MKHLIFITLLMITFSCKNNTIETEVRENLKALTFNNNNNNNNPWIVNNKTHIGFNNIETLIIDFKSLNDKNYSILGKLLAKQTSFIIKNCNMKGEAHEQLHIVLLPILDDISILKENSTIPQKKEALLRLTVYIKTYFKYFKN